jgi:ABC-type antimicrobial peptide transport system permease subunit
MALGARPRDTLLLVLWRGMAMAGCGVLIGTMAALGLTRLMSGLLFEVRPAEPTVYAAVAVTMLGLALAACAGPARRAVRVDPVTSLRQE